MAKMTVGVRLALALGIGLLIWALLAPGVFGNQ